MAARQTSIRSVARENPRATEKARRRRADTLRDARRGLIVDAAKTVFDTVGLEGASMRAIALEAGCTTGAIYPHFRGKEEIYAAVLSVSLASLNDFIGKRVARTAKPRLAARAGLQAFFDYYRTRTDELSLGLYLFRGLRPVGLNARLDKDLNRQLRQVFDLIEDQFRQNGNADPAAQTASGIAQAVGLLVLEQTGRLRLFGKTATRLYTAHLKDL